MRRRGITQTVNRFYYSTQSGEVTDGVVGALDIVVDSARQTDAWEAHFSQAFRTHVRTVTADNNQRINATLFQVFDSHRTHVFVAEFREAS